MIYYQGRQFMVYYDAQLQLCLSRKSEEGEWMKIVFPPEDSLSNGRNRRGVAYDTHNTPNVAISPVDGTVHLAWDHHVSELSYRVSKPGAATVSDDEWNLSLFKPKQNYLKEGQPLIITYPTFVVGQHNRLLMFWREGYPSRGELFTSEYRNGSWSGKVKVTAAGGGTYANSPDRFSYPNEVKYQNGKLHLTWCWREESTAASNHDLMYAYSEDNGRTWKNTTGAVVGTSGPESMKMNINSPGVKVWTIGYDKDLINQNSTTIDRNGNVHVVLRHSDEEGGVQAYYHYRLVNEQWSRRKIPLAAGRRAKLYVDPTDNTLYLVANVSNRIRIYSARSKNSWATWNEIYVSSANYTNATNGQISRDGTTLWVMGQRSGTGLRSRLDLITFTLNNTNEINLLSRNTLQTNAPTKTYRAERVLYPNPTQDYVEIPRSLSEPVVRYAIYDTTGSLVKEETALGPRQTQIDFSKYRAGWYIIEVEGGMRTETFRVVKE